MVKRFALRTDDYAFALLELLLYTVSDPGKSPLVRILGVQNQRNLSKKTSPEPRLLFIPTVLQGKKLENLKESNRELGLMVTI